ncbi:unnamed protein product [Nezara viridula]|uniref:FMP27/BLTP2/Hobbit GFWDK motif-containing RBG unit domain-containing protein n=1 Tax=Nezara viridula TaxID=85310 RepID=A0A9P0MUE5_NEZVI|nr:unnamed protein product [Nezara viridula]
MFGFLELAIGFFFIYCAITRLFPQCIRWIIKRCYHIEARIGRIGIPYMTLHDVQLCTNGYTIEIDQIGFRSSFLSSEVSKLVNVVIHDMRINKDMVSHSKNSVWRPPETFDNVRIPPLVITIAQFVSVRILNLTLAVVTHSLVLHSTLTEVSTDASVVHSTRCLLVSLNLASSTARLLSVSGRVHVSAASVSIEASLVASTPLTVQNVSVSFKNMKTVIDDDFFPNMERKQKKDVENKADKEEKTDFKQLINTSAPILPKELSISFDNCIITDATDRDKTTLQKLLINTRFRPSIRKYCGLYGSFGINFIFEGLDMRSATDTQLVLKLMEFSANLGEKGLIIKTVVREFTTLYDHDKMNWLSEFLPQTDDKEKIVEEKKDWWPDIDIDAKFEFWNVSTALRMPNLSPAVVGFSHLKFAYDSTLNGQTASGEIWELLSESIWCQLAKFGGPGNLRKEHTWGTALAAGLVLVKGGNSRSSALLDTVRLEWSPPFADILSPLVSMLVSRLIKPKKTKQSVKQKNLNISLANTNLFFIANKKVCLMLRVDSAGIESSLPTKMSLEAEGMKLSSISPTTSTFLCVKSSDIKNCSGSIELLRGDWNKSQNILHLKISRQIQLQWNPNLHLKFMEMFLHLTDFYKGVQNKDHHSLSKQDVSNKQLSMDIVITGTVRLVLKLSKHHYFTLTTDDFIYNRSGIDCSWSTSQLKMAVDSADIFTVEALGFAIVHENSRCKDIVKLIKTERCNNEEFVLPWNRTWHIKMRSIKAIFPYEHNFSSAFQDDFITVFKWLKRLHKKSPVQYQKLPLPPDLLIKIEDFLFEMSDDPFEVRLRDNYELLEDEYNESLKREKMLDEKINEMMKTDVMLPAGKVEELYNTLSILSTRIYIKRSKLMKEQGTRTRLFAWLVSDLQLLALTDPTIHGPENVVDNMTQIDPESPWPAEGLEFSTLWCRAVVINCKELKFQLRDFPQPWLDLRELQMWGKVVGAEQIPTRRAKRIVKLELGEGWNSVEIERSMTSLKLYHDLNCEIEHFSYAFGPCWEPVIAQCNLSFEKIMRGSLDPSPPLPLWDKLRLLLHGRITLVIRQLTVLLHASLDPYNKTEEMEITWSSVAIDWTNAKVVFKGNLDIYVRTASKYDDCRLLHLPNLRLSVKLGWACIGDPNDHHSVMPCAPDKLPDYSSNQEHDSFRAFRSQNLNIRLALETKPVASSVGNDFNCPVALLYGSTLRWFENLKLILSGVTRPTRRGSVFHNLRPRKLPLSRHYKKVHLLLSLHTFQVHYWMSFSMQRGFELTGESIGFSSEHLLCLVPINDNLKHRPRAEWSVVYMTCELHAAEIWLRSAIQENKESNEKLSLRQPVEKCYFLSVGKVSYGREGVGLVDSKVNPTHRLVVYGLKGAWTTSNRDVVAALYDTFIKTKQLKKNLSTEALKGFRREPNTSLKPQSHPTEPNQTPNISTSNTNNLQQQATPSPLSKLQCGHAATMLQQLIAEADTKAVVFSDEPTTEANEQQLQGLAACQHTDDVIHKNWLIALVNSQVLLKGPETEGYVIISAAKAEILQSVHCPVWRDRQLVAKTTWIGSLQSMQYYATVSAGKASLDENIMWLSVDNIKEKDDCVIAELPDVPQLVGSGQSVGGVVSETVGPSSAGIEPPLQLQRIVSRCKCEFFYVCYGENSMSPSNFAVVPTPPSEDNSSLWENQTQPVDAFTLMHHDLEVCTNSLQYAMLLDIVNNLLLYVEQSRREAYERVQRMRFQLQLQSVEDQRRPIQEAQTRVRALLSKIKGLEKEMYIVQRALGDEPNSLHLIQQIESLERQVFVCKESLTVQSEELNAMLSCYKETQLMGQKSTNHARKGDSSVSVVRASEICFKHAQWRLTEADGQLGIADLVLSNFLYTKNSKSDDSVEHLLELGYVRMTNLLPNQIYKEVLQPTEIHNNMPVDRKRALRVFCREKAPVGGISVKEHFEINLVPLTIGLTKKFFNKMLKFCFPERDTEEGEPDDNSSVEGGKKGKIHHKGKEASFYVPIERKDDVEKMKERAEKNKLFIYIKIPEVPVKVSYKGNKEKNIEDIRDFSLVIPTLEYHNVTWTWLDLLLAMKSDSRRVILSQAIKQKLQINKFRTGSDEGPSPQEEDKARMLFGNRHMPGENKSLKRGIFKFQK